MYYKMVLFFTYRYDERDVNIYHTYNKFFIYITYVKNIHAELVHGQQRWLIKNRTAHDQNICNEYRNRPIRGRPECDFSRRHPETPWPFAGGGGLSRQWTEKKIKTWTFCLFFTLPFFWSPRTGLRDTFRSNTFHLVVSYECTGSRLSWRFRDARSCESGRYDTRSCGYTCPNLCSFASNMQWHGRPSDTFQRFCGIKDARTSLHQWHVDKKPVERFQTNKIFSVCIYTYIYMRISIFEQYVEYVWNAYKMRLDKKFQSSSLN